MWQVVPPSLPRASLHPSPGEGGPCPGAPVRTKEAEEGHKGSCQFGPHGFSSSPTQASPQCPWASP